MSTKNTKNSRLRGLPAKLSANELANMSGSFPTIARTVLDNRNGKAPVIFSDDRTERILPVGQSRRIVYPLGMTPEAISSSIDAGLRAVLIPEGSISVVVPEQSMEFGTTDFFVQPSYSAPSQNLEPWSDCANPESDQGSFENRFYATGSAVSDIGFGFTSPLRSKTKIEIDLTPSAVHSVSCLTTSGAVNNVNHPMSYWNNDRKLFEGIGTGKALYSYPNTLNGLRSFLDEQTLGFAASIDNASSITGFAAGQYNLYGRVFDDAGFPFHPKFIPTSSQCISLSDRITEPFLLEKVVYEFSGSLKVDTGNSNTAIWTWFLLNKRPFLSGSVTKAQTVDYLVGGAGTVSSFTTSSFTGQHYVDIIDYAQVAVSASGDTSNYLCRESTVLTPWPSIWTGTASAKQLILSSSCKNPVSYDAGLLTSFSGALGGYRAFVPTLDRSGRNAGLTDSNGREWLNSNAKSTVAGTGSYSIGAGTVTFEINDFYSKINPYVLMPGDQLTVGFQLPWDRFGGMTSTSFEFAASGINKVILYGSLLRFDPTSGQLVEADDGLNQNLTSNAIHEEIVS
jgi:hypothetical protein